MLLNLRSRLLTATLFGLFFCLMIANAEAKTHHHKKHVTQHTKHHGKKTGHADRDLKTAQIHLAHLDYYKDKADGVMGPHTKVALKNFQHDHHLPLSGTLTTRTYNAIIEADLPPPLPLTSLPEPKGPDFYATHPDFYGHYDQQYANPLMIAPAIISSDGSSPIHSQAILSRFAKLDISEEVKGQEKRYNITLNGQSLLAVDNQPSVIGISRTYELSNEDAIILSTYRSESDVCAYRNYLLTMKDGSNNLQEIGNCTHGYQARINEGSLFITFPESDDGRVIGNTWRYDNGDLERL